MSPWAYNFGQTDKARWWSLAPSKGHCSKYTKNQTSVRSEAVNFYSMCSRVMNSVIYTSIQLWTLWSIHSLYILNSTFFIYSEWIYKEWRAKLSCEAWPILKVSIHLTGRDTTHIFWTYRTDTTCSFWTEMAIYGHGMGHTFCFLKKPIHSGLIFWTYGTEKNYLFWTGVTIYGHKVTYIVFLKNPVHSGLRSPYMVIKRTFCFWKSLFILDWNDHIWAWYRAFTNSDFLNSNYSTSKYSNSRNSTGIIYIFFHPIKTSHSRPLNHWCAVSSLEHNMRVRVNHWRRDRPEG